MVKIAIFSPLDRGPTDLCHHRVYGVRRLASGVRRLPYQAVTQWICLKFCMYIPMGPIRMPENYFFDRFA